MRLGVVDHLLNLFFGESAGGGDGDVLLLAGAEILCGDVHDAVGVDVERDLDLRHAAAGRGDAVELEAAEALVVSGHLTLALQDVDLNGGLVVGRGGEHLALLGRDGGVALDELREHAAEGLDAEGQRGDVEQNHIVDFAAEHAALDGRACRNDFIGIDALMRFSSEDRLRHFLSFRHSCHAADENNFVDFVLGNARVADAVFAGTDGALKQIVAEFFEFRSRKSDLKVKRTGLVHRDEREVDFRAHAG